MLLLFLSTIGFRESSSGTRVSQWAAASVCKKIVTHPHKEGCDLAKLGAEHARQAGERGGDYHWAYHQARRGTLAWVSRQTLWNWTVYRAGKDCWWWHKVDIGVKKRRVGGCPSTFIVLVMVIFVDPVEEIGSICPAESESQVTHVSRSCNTCPSSPYLFSSMDLYKISFKMYLSL